MAEQTLPKLPSFRTLISQAETPADLAVALQAERERLKTLNQRQPQGMRACRALSDACDQVIQRMLQLALPPSIPEREATGRRIAVVATGGYGRRELCPFSDLDVTFIVAEEEDPLVDAAVRQMFLSLMEIFSQRLGLKVGYGYRSLADVEQLDHQTQTALLDTRVVAGSHGLTDRFLQQVFRSLWPAAFIRRKLVERAALAEKHGGTLYCVEPQVKEGPGGLREIHIAEWLAAVSFPSTRGDVWRQLQRLGTVTRRDVQQVAAAREFLLMVRTWMHWHSGRPADALIRERQEYLAEALHYEDDDYASRVERFMERFYEHAENAARVSGFVVERCLQERLAISEELACAGDELLPAYPWVRAASPQFLVEMCQLYQEHGLRPGYELRRMVAQQIGSCPTLCSDTEAADDFLGLLRAPAPVCLPGPSSSGQRIPGVYDTLELMADLGILQRLIPEIGEAYGRVPFDQIHRHTIGHHCLQVVRSLESLRASEEESLAEFRRIWSEIRAPELLYLSGLLHDVGKLAPGSGHADKGARMAQEICACLGLDPPSTARVDALVRHHLLMSETAQLRDLTLDKTIRDFTQVIDSPELLNMLLLLTYADMEATGVLSPMKVRFLLDLYYRAEPVLSNPEGGAAQPVPPDRERRFRSRISRQLSQANLTPEQISEHTEGMPVSYLLNTRPEQIALHIRMVETLAKNGPVVEFENELGSDVTTVHVCTLEHPEPGLLSKIAGVLYAHEISVHGAQVFTRHSEPAVALDSLWADYHGRSIPPFKRLELEQDLVAALKGEDVEQVIRRCRKQLPTAIEPRRVRVDNEVAERHTVLEIEAEDQPALLYRITRAIAALGWDIHSARIATRGDRARDAFYVTSPDGGKLVESDAHLADAFLAEFAR